VTRRVIIWVGGRDPGVLVTDIDPPLMTGEVEITVQDDLPRPLLVSVDSVALEELFSHLPPVAFSFSTRT
jgi:hypothetical protein